jgi:hypothetical protein
VLKILPMMKVLTAMTKVLTAMMKVLTAMEMPDAGGGGQCYAPSAAGRGLKFLKCPAQAHTQRTGLRIPPNSPRAACSACGMWTAGCAWVAGCGVRQDPMMATPAGNFWA